MVVAIVRRRLLVVTEDKWSHPPSQRLLEQCFNGAAEERSMERTQYATER